MKAILTMKQILCCLIILSASFCHAQQSQGRAHAETPNIPNGITYSVHQYRESAPLRAGQVGIAYPNDASGKLPIVICIHGGGWSKGDKDQMAWMAIRYAQRGYIGVTIAYRLNHEAPIPACVLDVKEAIRYVKSISDNIHADPDRVAVLGYSAGAHLALMVGLSPEAKEFKSDAYHDQDSSVDCVVAISTPTDFEERLKRRGQLGFMPKEKSSDLDFIRPLAPLTWMHADQVPVLMLHGDQDPIVPAYNYEHFARKCQQLSIDNFELFVHEGGKHMFFFQEQKTTQPIVDRFLAKHLKH